jgi:hypothetical protein
MNVLKSLTCILAGIAMACSNGALLASTPSSAQSTIKPYFGSLAGLVQLAGSDTLSQAFQTLEPTYLSLVKSKLPETVAFTGIGLNQLDPAKLYFLSSYAPRVYFLYEETGAIDQLGVTIGSVAKPTTGPITGTSYTIFPSGRSCNDPLYSPGNGVRTSTYPLYPGDFVQLPTVNAGQQLGFCLGNGVNSNGVPALTNGQSTIFYNGVSTIDNTQHMIAFFPDTTSQYIIIGFEDWAFGDQDCNDLVFVVDIGPQNAAAWRAGSTMPK